MSIEELQLILNTVSNVSNGALSVTILWVFVANVLPIIAWLLAGLGVFKLAKELVPLCFLMDSNAQLMILRDKLNIGTKGYIYGSEIQELFIKLNELVDKEKDNE